MKARDTIAQRTFITIPDNEPPSSKHLRFTGRQPRPEAPTITLAESTRRPSKRCSEPPPGAFSSNLSNLRKKSKSAHGFALVLLIYLANP